MYFPHLAQLPAQNLGDAAARRLVPGTELKGWPRTQGLPGSSETLQFAEELLARIPRAGAAPNAYRERERTAAALVRRNMSYALLSDDEDDGAEPPPAPTTAPVPKPAKQKKLRKAKACAAFCALSFACLPATCCVQKYI